MDFSSELVKFEKITDFAKETRISLQNMDLTLFGGFGQFSGSFLVRHALSFYFLHVNNQKNTFHNSITKLETFYARFEHRS